MPAEDRDRLFENALAQHLRANTAADNSACLGAELFAAYHERLLSPEEMTAAKDHLVSCARCQEILAQLEATQNIQDLQNNETDLAVSAMKARAHAAGVVEEAVFEPVARRATQKPLEKIAPLPARKNMLLRWAAPAGAIAAGLLLWIGVREFRTQPKMAGESTEIADSRAQSSRNLDVAPAPPQPAGKEKAELSRDQAYMVQPLAPAAAEPREQRKAPRSAGSAEDRLRADKKALPPPSISDSRVASSPALEAGHGEGSGLAGAVAKNEQPAAITETVVVESAQPEVVAPQNDMKLQTSGAARPAAAPPAAPAPSKARRETAATAEAASPVIESKDANQPAALSNAFYNQSELTSSVMAPDGQSLWRFGPGGGILHSPDAGHTWLAQSSGVIATLTNGSAPSNNVCWIAGTGGTLLYTKDGGKHWKVIATPIAGDLGGVRATDAKHASIWGPAHRLSYETSDGGATWTPSANE